MAYDPQTWALGLAGGTALNPAHLNYMEQGIADAHSLIVDLAPAVHTHVTVDITDATASNVVDTIVKRDGSGAIAVSAVSGLSTATGNTQAVPKSQLDSGLADKAGTAHTHVVANVTDVTATGTSLATAANAAAARTAISAAAATHTHTAVDVSDSTTVGRSVLTAADAAAARTAIGAGTSSLALGTSSSTAKAGDYAPAAASDTAQGIVELATSAEALTGTDTARATTPAGVKAVADTKADKVVTTTTQSGTTYTLVLADFGTDIEFTNAAGCAVTIPTNASVAASIGSITTFWQRGAGQVVVGGPSAGASGGTSGGVTVESRGSVFKTAGLNAPMSVKKRATDGHLVSGDISS